ncbi:MAG: competence/damage-inducible protein A [Bacteroidales bacterium]|jgi:nicotinamide-nucleotide amidase|nr:competence/damage-inducible protein A [Bacteroidales bacterium]
MLVEIINIGDELLIGQVINTNAAWMAEQLNLSGFTVLRFTVISDSREQILEALHEAEKRAEIVLISGGIGPTKDDITKTTLCAFFNTHLVFNEDAYRDIQIFFALRGHQVTDLNRKQADLPERCFTLPNKLGTARGMWFEKKRTTEGKTVFVSMPGVPFEMKEMMINEVIPRLQKSFSTPYIYHKTVLTQGIGESFLATRIEAWENSLPKNIKLAYLPQPGMVRLRLTGTADDEQKLRHQVDSAIAELEPIISEYIFGYDEETLEEIIGRLLREKGNSLATAESCTGGYIAHLITSIPGSSDYFKGSIVAYSNEIKENLLFVSPEILAKFGAVSEETVEEMAVSAQTQFNADYIIATSGIAGPSGGTTEKPVGTTWIAIAAQEEVFARKFLFGDSRDRNIRRTALQALAMLRKKLLE